MVRAVDQDGSVRALLGLSDAELAPLLAKLRRAPARALEVDDFVRLAAAHRADKGGGGVDAMGRLYSCGSCSCGLV